MVACAVTEHLILYPSFPCLSLVVPFCEVLSVLLDFPRMADAHLACGSPEALAVDGSGDSEPRTEGGGLSVTVGMCIVGGKLRTEGG